MSEAGLIDDGHHGFRTVDRQRSKTASFAARHDDGLHQRESLCGYDRDLLTRPSDSPADDVVEALREAATRDVAELTSELIARVRSRDWSLAISGNEIRRTWAEGFIKGSLPATPIGYSLDEGGRAWYVFSRRAQVQPFGGTDELIPMDLTGAQIFDLAISADIRELTVDPAARPFRLGRPYLEALQVGPLE